jgi:hypothetical protein
MNVDLLRPMVHTPFAELDLLFAELGHDADERPPRPAADERDPDTVDAFNAQILAGLVSP